MTLAVRGPGDGSVREHNPTVSWFELFYDLVLVAAIGQCNDSFLGHPSASMALTATLAIAALSWVWFVSTLVNNLLPGEDLLSRLLVLAQMAAVVVASLSVDQANGIGNSTGLAAFGIALGLVALLVLWSGRGLTRPDRTRAALPLAVAAAISLVGSLIAGVQTWVFVIAALAVSIVPILTAEFSRWQVSARLRVDHLRERLGLFVLIILGEGFAQLVHALHSLGTIPRSGVYALTFLLSFALWWIYFEGTFSRHTDLSSVRWRVSLLAHLTLVLGMIGTLDVLVLLTVQEGDVLGDATFAYFVISLALVLFSFATLGFTARGRLGVAGWVQIASGLAILGGGALVLPGEDASLTLIIGGCAIVIIANALVTVVVDQGGAPGAWNVALGRALRGSGADEDNE